MARKFPVLAVIILLFSVVWFFRELNYLTTDIPWLPVVLGVISLGMIFNRFR